MAQDLVRTRTLAVLVLTLGVIAPWAALGQRSRPTPTPAAPAAVRVQTPKEQKAPPAQPEIKRLAGSFLPHPRYLSRYSHAPLNLRIKVSPPRKTAEQPLSPLDRLSNIRDANLQQQIRQLRQETLYAPTANPSGGEEDPKKTPKIVPTPLYRMPGAEQK